MKYPYPRAQHTPDNSRPSPSLPTGQEDPLAELKRQNAWLKEDRIRLRRLLTEVLEAFNTCGEHNECDPDLCRLSAVPTICVIRRVQLG